MAVTVETLDKLERKITLTLPVNAIQSEVESRLKKLARTVKVDGFRPGKVPMNVVAQRYGYSVQYEVHERQGRRGLRRRPPTKPSCASPASRDHREGRRARRRAGLRRDVRGLSRSEDRRPGRRPKSRSVSAEVTDAAIDKTLDILRKQRRTFAQRPQPTPPPQTATA